MENHTDLQIEKFHRLLQGLMDHSKLNNNNNNKQPPQMRKFETIQHQYHLPLYLHLLLVLTLYHHMDSKNKVFEGILF